MHRVRIPTVLVASRRYGHVIRSGQSSQESRSHRFTMPREPNFYNAIISVTRHSDSMPVEGSSMGRSRGSMLGYRSKFTLLSLVMCLCLAVFCPMANAQRGGVRKSAAKKNADAQKQDPPATPAYTPSPLQPVPLDQVPAVAPKVTFEGGQLTVIAHNCTLADVLHAIK